MIDLVSPFLARALPMRGFGIKARVLAILMLVTAGAAARVPFRHWLFVTAPAHVAGVSASTRASLISVCRSDSIVATLEKIAQQGPHYKNVSSYELATES